MIDGNWIFSSLLAIVRPRPKADKRTPPQIWGALCNTLNLTQVKEELGHQIFDIVIDDGNHVPLAQQAALRAIWNYLRQGGFYLVEDMSTAWPLQGTMNHSPKAPTR